MIRVQYEAPDEEAEQEAAPTETQAPAAEPEASVEPAAPADEPESYARIRAFVSGLLEHMGIQAQIDITARDNGGVNVNLSGSGMGAVIGRRGETLDAIQHLTNYAVNRGSDKHMHISVDAGAIAPSARSRSCVWPRRWPPRPSSISAAWRLSR